MKRILIDALTANTGGGWTYLVNLVAELERDDRGLDFTVLVEAERAAGLDASCVRIVPIETGGTFKRVLYEEFVLPWRARAFDLLYCVAELAPAFAFTPTVVALRNLNVYDRRFYDTSRLRWLERLTRAGARRAHRVLFPSAASAAWISRHLGIDATRTAVVPHGIAPEIFTRFEADEAERSRPYLLVPAAVERHKNIEVTVAAMQEIDETIELWIAGGTETDPDYVASLRAQAVASGVLERVRFLGGVSYGKMVGFYRHAMGVVLPSRIETFGHPLLEAMALERPLLVSDLPVFHEIANGAAWRFGLDAPHELAAAVRRIQDEPDEVERRIGLGRERVALYSWARSVDRLCEVFHEIVD
ncbi:MAG: glycosyltransferase family 1 protein [Myxococcota bacterium]